jgi:hypothetical protein
MTSPAEKLRRVIALRDGAQTDGERQACESAIERLKASVPPEAFTEAKRKAKQTVENFARDWNLEHPGRWQGSTFHSRRSADPFDDPFGLVEFLREWIP